MHAALPSRPLATSEEGEGGVRVLRCYTAPGQTFSSEDEVKQHYRSDLHKLNLKRKVAGLAPLTQHQFEERESRTAREAAASSQRAGKLSTAERRQQREERREQRLAAKSKNPNSKAAHMVATAQMTEDEYFKHKIEAAPEFDIGCDLFSRHRSVNLEENLSHMAREHGFYLPYLDYCVDVAGLVHYLQQKVYIGNVALLTGRQFHSVEAVQAHMRSKRQCRFELEGNEDEFGEYYDMEALAAGSPLWELEAVSDGEEEGEEEADGEGGEEGEIGLPDGFDALFERAVSLGVVSEADVDTLTDSIAAGSMTEDEALAEWLPAVRHAQRAARRRDGKAEDATASSAPSGGSYRVVYRPLALSVPEGPGVESLPTLNLGDREAGHRSMAKYFKQKYKPSANEPGALGSLGVHRPELARLMHQYANAGVLSTQLQIKFKPSPVKSELNRRDLHKEQRMHVMQGLKNNTAGPGRKHYKEQSLCY